MRPVCSSAFSQSDLAMPTDGIGGTPVLLTRTWLLARKGKRVKLTNQLSTLNVQHSTLKSITTKQNWTNSPARAKKLLYC